ncbi:hypothetical protein ZIOFF_055697 [Zingiber officinale]|uniref:Uncharacterized protein n=1 Tax=Zingiber officinale TaxID=94328 RepID=A0A8J5KSG3_ZINOF|nr:hypothetical protein ZIOFF_055697 [Zingiber officinale]
MGVVAHKLPRTQAHRGARRRREFRRRSNDPIESRNVTPGSGSVHGRLRRICLQLAPPWLPLLRLLRHVTGLGEAPKLEISPLIRLGGSTNYGLTHMAVTPLDLVTCTTQLNLDGTCLQYEMPGNGHEKARAFFLKDATWLFIKFVILGFELPLLQVLCWNLMQTYCILRFAKMIDPDKYKNISAWFTVLLNEQCFRGFFKFEFYEFFKKLSSEFAGPEHASKIQTQPGFAKGLRDGLPKFVASEALPGTSSTMRTSNSLKRALGRKRVATVDGEQRRETVSSAGLLLVSVEQRGDAGRWASASNDKLLLGSASSGAMADFFEQQQATRRKRREDGRVSRRETICHDGEKESGVGRVI